MRPRRVRPEAPQISGAQPAETAPPKQPNAEPTVRIGLSTNARAIDISDFGGLVATSGQNGAIDLSTSKVHVESSSFARAALDDEPGEAHKNSGAVKLTALTAPASRGLTVLDSDELLMEAREPVTFSSVNEASGPVRFNGKPYRGRLEVFANDRGSLTVVNVIGIEEYVRAVVPKELSPGAYPALEALKAQAVAARTYALANLGRFAAEGFDLTPDTHSQVYGGIAAEQPLSSEAVEATRGIVATYNGAPINALYTSTCGGRTEDVEKIFGGPALPYLRSGECGIDAGTEADGLVIRSSRDPQRVQEAEHLHSLHEIALLSVNNVRLTSHVTDAWLAAPFDLEELKRLFEAVAVMRHAPIPRLSDEALRPAGFSSALSLLIYGESRGGVLLDDADVGYILWFQDAGEIPLKNRADVAFLVKEGALAPFPDATLHVHENLSRQRVIHAVAHLLEAKEMLHLRKGTAVPSGLTDLRVREQNGAYNSLAVYPDAYLFLASGGRLYGVRSLSLVGGESLAYHTGPGKQIDYLEVRPGNNGAAADRWSPFSNWTTSLSPSELRRRLSSLIGNIGSIVEINVVERGQSKRVLDLEVIGTKGVAHIRGGRIRSALGLKEQLFVVDYKVSESGDIEAFVFTGRGWGHGVGMCQVGAYGLARAGWTYDRILKAYYSGIDLTRLY